MKVSSICVAQPAKTNYNLKTRKSAQPKMLVQEQQVPFKGLKAGFMSLLGTGIGVAAGAVLSGGLLAPLLLGCTGTYAGALYGKSKENDDTDQYGR